MPEVSPVRLTPLLVAALFFAWSASATTLTFSQDTFIFDPGDRYLDLTVELHSINEATNSFRLTASGTIRNEVWGYMEPDDGLDYYPFRNIVLEQTPGLEDVVTSVVGWSIPAGPGVVPEDIIQRCFHLGIGALAQGSYMCAGFPTLVEPFDWSATFEVTHPDLVGDYFMSSQSGFGAAWRRPDGTWEHLYGEGYGYLPMSFSIQPIPEPSSTVLLAAGVIVLAVHTRRARRV
jgi:hypothetical protein